MKEKIDVSQKPIFDERNEKEKRKKQKQKQSREEKKEKKNVHFLSHTHLKEPSS